MPSYEVPRVRQQIVVSHPLEHYWHTWRCVTLTVPHPAYTKLKVDKWEKFSPSPALPTGQSQSQRDNVWKIGFAQSGSSEKYGRRGRGASHRSRYNISQIYVTVLYFSSGSGRAWHGDSPPRRVCKREMLSRGIEGCTAIILANLFVKYIHFRKASRKKLVVIMEKWDRNGGACGTHLHNSDGSRWPRFKIVHFFPFTTSF